MRKRNTKTKEIERDRVKVTDTKKGEGFAPSLLRLGLRSALRFWFRVRR